MSDLDSRMAAVLLRLELVSHGSTQAWNASGGHSGEPDDRMVAMVGRCHDFPHLLFRREYEAQWGDVGRREVIARAEEELKAWTRNTAKRPDVVKSDDDIIIEDGKGWDPVTVALRFRTTPRYVRRLRVARGLGIEDGKSGSGGLGEMAASLSRRGLSQVEIGKRLGVSQPTVHRLLKEQRFRRAAA